MNNEIQFERVPNPVLDVEQNPPNSVLDVEQNDAQQPEIVVRHAESPPNPDFFYRWGSFMQFIIHGREMDGGIHLRERYHVNDHLEVIDKPEEEKKPVLDVEEEGNDRQPQLDIEEEEPSPLHRYHLWHDVYKDNHITGKKEQVKVKDAAPTLPEYTKTTYTIDKIYRHTTIDEKTRTREEDFWVDKEVKCYAIIGAVIGVAICAVIFLPFAAAIAVSGVAVAILAVMAKRSMEATPEVYAWRDTIPEHFDIRQNIGFNHNLYKNGARRLYQRALAGEESIGKVFHPQEVKKFWVEGKERFDEDFSRYLDDAKKADEVDIQALDHFFIDNPYLSYEYIAKHVAIDDRDDRRSSLRETFMKMKEIYEESQWNAKTRREELEQHKKEESHHQKVYVQKVDHARDKMVHELGPKPKENDEEWKEKERKILDIHQHYLEKIETAFTPRKRAFAQWYLGRQNKIQANETIDLQEIRPPVWEWWNRDRQIGQDAWSLENVVIPQKVHNEHPVKKPNLPCKPSFEEMIQPPKGDQFDPATAQAFSLELQKA